MSDCDRPNCATPSLASPSSTLIAMIGLEQASQPIPAILRPQVWVDPTEGLNNCTETSGAARLSLRDRGMVFPLLDGQSRVRPSPASAR